ncbi:MAG: carboxymuconolactone decarboxylase family protein [Luteimonas sp.]
MSKLDYFAAAPSAMKAWMAASAKINASLDPALVRLVEIRTSQINGCANCINMHTTHAREAGETEQRMHLLAAWRDAPCYSARERAALAWTEAMTRLADGSRAHEEAFAALEAEFTAEEQAVLTLVINVINGWNRLSVGFGSWIDPDDAKRYQQASAA